MSTKFRLVGEHKVKGLKIAYLKVVEFNWIRNRMVDARKSFCGGRRCLVSLTVGGGLNVDKSAKRIARHVGDYGYVKISQG